MKKIRKPLLYILGLTILGLSVTLIQSANLGMSPWDALNRNFYEGIPLEYRYLTPIVAIVLVSLAYIIDKKKPDVIMLFPILISFYIGFVIDLLLLIVPNVENKGLLINLIYIFSAFILVGIGLNILLLSKYPLPALDQFCFALSKRLKITFGKGKIIGEVIALVLTVIVGLIFRHQSQWFYIGWTTVLAIIFIGRFVDIFAKPINWIMGEKIGN